MACERQTTKNDLRHATQYSVQHVCRCCSSKLSVQRDGENNVDISQSVVVASARRGLSLPPSHLVTHDSLAVLFFPAFHFISLLTATAGIAAEGRFLPSAKTSV